MTQPSFQPLLAIGPVLRVFDPDSPQAGAIVHLGVIANIILAAIFVIVAGIVVYALMRFRWREGEPDPHQFASSPNFDPVPLTPETIGATNGPVFQDAQLFQEKACLNCHLIQGHGGRRGPNLTYIADLLTKDNMTIRIVNGGVNMPAFGAKLKSQEINDLVAFLETRKKH